MSPYGLLVSFRDAVAQDLELLASLHDRELDETLLANLRRAGFPDGLGLVPRKRETVEALEFMQEAMSGLLFPLESETLDDLAADYAAIYLTHALSASPCESVWCDEDGLAMQEPMFEVRECYRRHGLGSADWRSRSDDHLCLQLGFLAFLARDGRLESLNEACKFMDGHLLRWLPRFAARVSHRCDTPFYAGAAMLTVAYCEELRDILAELLGEHRVESENSVGQQAPATPQEIPMRYMPGVAPSW